MKKRLALLLCLAAFPAAAAEYAVDYAKSSIAFRGRHAGKAFTGSFGAWQADIRFDPASPGEARIAVTLDTGSAKTGDAMYDSTLPSTDWLDVKNHKQAQFISTAVNRKPDGSYTAQGELSIRSRSKTILFAFTLQPPQAEGRTRTQFSLPLHRSDFGIGAQSDPNAEWVDDLITVDVTLEASPK